MRQNSRALQQRSCPRPRSSARAERRRQRQVGVHAACCRIGDRRRLRTRMRPDALAVYVLARHRHRDRVRRAAAPVVDADARDPGGRWMQSTISRKSCTGSPLIGDDAIAGLQSGARRRPVGARPRRAPPDRRHPELEAQVRGTAPQGSVRRRRCGRIGHGRGRRCARSPSLPRTPSAIWRAGADRIEQTEYHIALARDRACR